MGKQVKGKSSRKKVSENRKSAHEKEVSAKWKPMTPKEGEDDDNPAF